MYRRRHKNNIPSAYVYEGRKVMRRGDPAAPPLCFGLWGLQRATRGKGGPMIPAAFDYHRPETLDEALKLLKKHGDEAKVLSGGMSLLPMLKLRLASSAHLVDLNRIPGLDTIKEEKGFLRIGAMVRQAALERSDLIRSKVP